MPRRLTCTTCAAPLDVPDDGSAVVRCAYCGGTVELPGERRGAAGARPRVDLGRILTEVHFRVRSQQARTIWYVTILMVAALAVLLGVLILRR
jgi:LSD1 subclass zinc finger protein